MYLLGHQNYRTQTRKILRFHNNFAFHVIWRKVQTSTGKGPASERDLVLEERGTNSGHLN
jgi:hypothetical protein